MSYIANVIIDELVTEPDSGAHISRNGISLAEALETLAGVRVVAASSSDPERYLVIGKTDADRTITVVLGARSRKNTYGLITARPSRRSERAMYSEQIALSGLEDS